MKMIYGFYPLHLHKPNQFHSVEQAVSGIGLYVNSDKTQLIWFNQDGAISFNGKSLILVEQFTYLGCKISFTENDVNLRVGKA